MLDYIHGVNYKKTKIWHTSPHDKYLELSDYTRKLRSMYRKLMIDPDMVSEDEVNDEYQRAGIT